VGGFRAPSPSGGGNREPTPTGNQKQRSSFMEAGANGVLTVGRRPSGSNEGAGITHLATRFGLVRIATSVVVPDRSSGWVVGLGVQERQAGCSTIRQQLFVWSSGVGQPLQRGGSMRGT
jgi:hypothetical protein